VDKDGNLLVSHFPASRLSKEATPDRITVWSPAGQLLREWGKSGTGDGELSWPGGIAVGKDGRVYVADQTNRRVQVFDGAGKFLMKWGTYGTRPGEFGGNTAKASRVGGPQFVVIDRAGCFADEPTGALDWANGEHVIGLLRTKAHECGAAVLVASQDARIIPYSDRVCHLEDGRLREA
jgi:hypothetical protein